MHTNVIASLVLLVGILGFPARTEASNPPVELLVKWKDGPNSRAAAEGNARSGSTVQRNFHALGWQAVQLRPSIQAAEGIRLYRGFEGVLAVEANTAVSITMPRDGVTPAADGTPRLAAVSEIRPNDPRFRDQWHLRKIAAPSAWVTTTGTTHSVVVIFDSGVDYNHPDLAENMWRNPGETGVDASGKDRATNGIDDDDNGYIDDVHGIDTVKGSGDPMDVGFWDSTAGDPSARTWHGTSIAGLIGAVGNNGLGVTGVNWKARVMAIRHYGGDVSKPITNYWRGYLAAWDYVLTMKRRGINIRIGSHSYGMPLDSEAVRDALNQAAKEGILNVCAAGNMSPPIDLDHLAMVPMAVDVPLMRVAATTENDTLWEYSNYGRSTVEIAAPGVNLTSTRALGAYNSGGASGTSFAAPIVAGAASLLLAREPNLTLDQLKAALMGSVDQPSALRGKLISNGRLNVARALAYITNDQASAVIVSTSPSGQGVDLLRPIRISFNRPMNRASVEAAFSIHPPLDGTFEWNDENRIITFSHGAPFDRSTNYTVRVLGFAQDELGRSLDGDFDRISEGSPTDDFVWTFRFGLPNDNFADAHSISDGSGRVQASNRYASVEIEEPWNASSDYRQFGSSVWYRWASPANGGWITFELDATFDSLLGAYLGERVDRLQQYAANDNYGTRVSSRLTFYALPGTNYSIQVASKDQVDPSKAGRFALSWYPTPPAGFTGGEFSPASASSGAKVVLTGTNFTGATAVLFNGASARFSPALTNHLDLRLTAVVPPEATSGPITVSTPHGNVTSSAWFEVLPPPLGVRRTGTSELEITWSATGDGFVLESTADLQSPLWETLGTRPVLAEGESRVVTSIAGQARYFRLRSKP